MTEDTAELARMKVELERQLQERKAEVAALQKRLRIISNVLRQLGVQPTESGSLDGQPFVRTVIRDRWGNPFANVDANPETVRITPAGFIPIDARKAPFRRFFIDRVLRSMQDEDEQAVLHGRLLRKEAISFECQEDRGMLVDLVVRHYGASQRLERIKDALNWALEKQQGKRLHST